MVRNSLEPDRPLIWSEFMAKYEIWQTHDHEGSWLVEGADDAVAVRMTCQRPP